MFKRILFGKIVHNLTETYRDLMGRLNTEPSAAIQTRVERAPKNQALRFRRAQVFCNAQMGCRHTRAHCAVGRESRQSLESAVGKLGLSARAFNRIVKIARPLADLVGIEKIGTVQIAEAIQYRPLDWRTPIS